MHRGSLSEDLSLIDKPGTGLEEQKHFDDEHGTPGKRPFLGGLSCWLHRHGWLAQGGLRASDLVAALDNEAFSR